jgi:hypothetical protein
VSKCAVSEELEKPAQSCGRLGRAGMPTRDIDRVNRDHVCNLDLGRIALTTARGFVLGPYVVGERSLSLLSLIRAEASALLELAVPNNPGRESTTVCGLEPETRAFASLRHSILMSRIAASVV